MYLYTRLSHILLLKLKISRLCILVVKILGLLIIICNKI